VSAPPGGSRLLSAALALLVLSTAVGCALTFDRRGPGEVARAFFFLACDRGDHEEAEELASEGLKTQLEGGVGALFGGIEGFCAYHTPDWGSWRRSRRWRRKSREGGRG
jgi:hypothetical protein